jgi:hypothetical protein
MSGASPWLQWRVGKWVANQRSDPDPDGREYDPYRDGPATPLFHFGEGLSYTAFAMSNLSVATTVAAAAPNTADDAPVLRVSVTVSNTGKVAGTEVVQVRAAWRAQHRNASPLCGRAPHCAGVERRCARCAQVYVVDPVMEYVRPWKRLLAFARVPLQPGATHRATIDVSRAQLSFQARKHRPIPPTARPHTPARSSASDAHPHPHASQDDSSAAGTWRVVPGTYQIRVGHSSVEDTLTADVDV